MALLNLNATGSVCWGVTRGQGGKFHGDAEMSQQCCKDVLQYNVFVLERP